MKPASFSFTRAQTLEQVFDLLNEYGDEAKIIAGGQSLLPTLNMRLSAPQLLIDISLLEELRGIRLEANRLIVGALTRHVELQQSELIARHTPLLATAVTHVAHAAIRNRGTLGGNLSLADPASELPACCLALGAEFTIANKTGQRAVQAKDYFRDLYETALQAGDMLVSISFPIASINSVCGFREFVRRQGDFACTGLAFNAELVDSQFTSISPVFFAISNTPVLATRSSAYLLNIPLNSNVIDAVIEELDKDLDIIGDIHTSLEMKLHLAKHFFREVLLEIHA